MNLYYGNFSSLNIGGGGMTPEEIQDLVDKTVEEKLGISEDTGTIDPVIVPEDFLNAETVDNAEALNPNNPGREGVIYVDEETNDIYIWKNKDDDHPELGGEYYLASTTPGARASDDDILNIFK